MASWGSLVCAIVSSCSVSWCCVDSVVLMFSRVSMVVGGGVSSSVRFDSMGGSISDPRNLLLGEGLVISMLLTWGLGDCSSSGECMCCAVCGVWGSLGVICAVTLSLGGTKLGGSVGLGRGFLLVCRLVSGMCGRCVDVFG